MFKLSLKKLIKKKLYIKNIIKFYLSKIFRLNNYFTYTSNFGKVFLDEINGGISKVIAFYGSREDDKQILLKESIYANTLYLDLGSNIGVYPFFVSNKFGDDNFLVSVEPDIRNHKTLFKNLQKCITNSIFLPFAISDIDGYSNFLISKATNLNHLISSKLNTEDKDLESIVNVRTISLETLFDKYIPKQYWTNNYNLLIRMDIEGGEYKVLNSLRKFLNYTNISFKNISIVYENHPPGNSNAFYKNVLEGLLDMGFSCKCLISAGGLKIKDLEFLFDKDTSYRYLKSDNFIRIRINRPLQEKSVEALISRRKLIRYCVLEKKN